MTESEATVGEFAPVEEELYRQLKTEIKSQEKQFYDHKWFFEDTRTPRDIKQRIEDKSDATDVDMKPGGI